MRTPIAATLLLTTVWTGWANGSAAAGVQEAATDADAEFVAVRAILAKQLVDAKGAGLGVVRDLVLDRDTGVASHVLVHVAERDVKVERKVAIPYGKVEWRATEDSFATELSAREIADLPTYEPKPGQVVAASAGSVLDRYSDLFDGTEQVRVSGEITAIEEDVEDQCLLVTLREGDHECRVLLAPGTHLPRGESGKPAEGRRIAVRAVEGSDDAGTLYVASACDLGAGSIRLRGREGEALWRAPRTILATELADLQIGVAGEAVGPVGAIYFDVQSGRAVFVILDLVEEAVPIPLGALELNEAGLLELDTFTKTDLDGAPRIHPGDASALDDPDRRATICRYFGLPPMLAPSH